MAHTKSTQETAFIYFFIYIYVYMYVLNAYIHTYVHLILIVIENKAIHLREKYER